MTHSCFPHHCPLSITPHCCLSICAPDPKLYVETYTPKRWYEKVKPLGSALCHEGRDLMNGIRSFIKGTQEGSLAPSAVWGHSEEMPIQVPGNGLLPDIRSAGP